MKLNGWSTRLQPIFKEAEDLSGAPGSPTEVVKWMSSGKLARLIDKDEELRTAVMRAGLNQLYRAHLKSKGIERVEKITAHQLSFWPEQDRKAVSDVKRIAIFVPSRAQFVEFTPVELSREEVIEAGRFLIAEGIDTTRRGQLIVRIGETSTAWD